MPNNESPLLRVQDLTVGFPQGPVLRKTVDAVSFSLDRGEGLAVVGESGSGKTTLALALLRLLPPPGTVLSGRVEFNGLDLLTQDARSLRRLRGAGISLVFQEPGRALNPRLRVLDQIVETVRAHERVSAREARQRALDALQATAVPEPSYTARLYPHQLSGGLQQRIVIAMALVCHPSLLIADEPTTALDVTVQRQILDLLARLRQDLRLGLLFITHDLALVPAVAQRVIVMRAGAVIEGGLVREVLQNPKAPYTQELIQALPRL